MSSVACIEVTIRCIKNTVSTSDFTALGHKHKLLNPSWKMPTDYLQLILAGRVIAGRFHWLETNPKDSSLERFPMLSKTKSVFQPRIIHLVNCFINHDILKLILA